jgi:hypothetical protein
MLLQCFTESDFATFLRDDQQLLRAAHARWMLLCEREPTCDSVDADSNSEAKGVYLSSSPSTLGSSAESDLLLADAAAAAQHARVWRDDLGDCYIEVRPCASCAKVQLLILSWFECQALSWVTATTLRWGVCWFVTTA